MRIITSGDSLKVLDHLCGLVAGAERPYEDVAEQIEDRAYELCENGSIDLVLQKLKRLTSFFEGLDDKNDEHCRDLADVYLLTGQIYQYAGLFTESIPWFSRSAVVDDRYPAPFHSLAESYSQLREYDNAIKSLEQEIMLAPGNYYSYLLLADLYEREDRTGEVEKSLKRLLERDPENIQGLHRLIRHYEETDDTIDTTLLIRRLMKISKRFNRMEAVIRSFYLCRVEKYIEAIEFLDNWKNGANVVTITHLVKAHVYSETRQYSRRRQILNDFKVQNHAREDVMRSKLHEFGTVFGDTAAERIEKLLLFSPEKSAKQ